MMNSPLKRIQPVWLIVFSCMAASVSDAQNAVVDLALIASGGHIAVMRHAIAPGTGDPVEFDVQDCTTQRNLDDAGRTQAHKAGELFRSSNIETLKVFSSQWCRCLETAQLLGFGPAKELPLLNSFFQNREMGEPQTRDLRDWISNQPLDDALLLVTHQVNITDLTGVYPASGEIVILKRLASGGLEVVSRIHPG